MKPGSRIPALLRELAGAFEARAAGVWTGDVYFIRAGAPGGPIKIGYARCPESRRLKLQVGNHLPLVVVLTVPGGEELEQRFHAAFGRSRIRGEWFASTPELEALLALLLDVRLDRVPEARSRAAQFMEAAGG